MHIAIVCFDGKDKFKSARSKTLCNFLTYSNFKEPFRFFSGQQCKFIIKESDEDDLKHEKRSDFGHCPDCTKGEAILLYYAKQAEDERKTNIAISLYEDADKLGSVEAAYRLGLLLIDTDYYKAYFYMNKAAQVGYADAKEKLVYFQSIR